MNTSFKTNMTNEARELLNQIVEELKLKGNYYQLSDEEYHDIIHSRFIEISMSDNHIYSDLEIRELSNNILEYLYSDYDIFIDHDSTEYYYTIYLPTYKPEYQ